MIDHKLEKISELGSDRNKTKGKILISVMCSCGEEKVFSMPDMIRTEEYEQEKIYYAAVKVHEHFIDKAYEEVNRGTV